MRRESILFALFETSFLSMVIIIILIIKIYKNVVHDPDLEIYIMCACDSTDDILLQNIIKNTHHNHIGKIQFANHIILRHLNVIGNSYYTQQQMALRNKLKYWYYGFAGHSVRM